MESGFYLAKWYFDCVAGDGEFFIGYAAAVRWKKFTVHYTSALRGGVKKDAASSSSLLSATVPVINNDTMEWSCKELDVSGSWKRTFAPVERTLLNNEHGSIRWSCIMPGAEARVQIGNSELHGFGYGELLEMTIPPWKLPIEELRWGRLVNDNNAVVWIDWKGAQPLRIVYYNGTLIDCGTLDDSEIASQNGNVHLRLDRSTLIRSGPLINTVLNKIPGIDAVIPGNILHTEECKWLSGATLMNDDHRRSTGFAIHELVRFK